MSTPEQQAQLAEMVKAARQALADCVAFADAHGLAFRWSSDYGSGQQVYEGRGVTEDEPVVAGKPYDSVSWESSSWEESDEDDEGTTAAKPRRPEGGWVSSSDHC